jgi:hypothetical protein
VVPVAGSSLGSARCTIRRITGVGVRQGEWWGGWTDRSSRPGPGPGSAGLSGGRWSADLEALGGPGFWPAMVHDGAGQSEAAELGQGCVTVGHEDLLGRGGVFGSSTPDPEVLPLINSAQGDSPCTNLPGQYS